MAFGAACVLVLNQWHREVVDVGGASGAHLAYFEIEHVAHDADSHARHAVDAPEGGVGLKQLRFPAHQPCVDPAGPDDEEIDDERQERLGAYEAPFFACKAAFAALHFGESSVVWHA